MIYCSGHGSCTFDITANEELEISIYTRSTSGAKFTVVDTLQGKAPCVENALVKHAGTESVEEIPTFMTITEEKIIGPASVKLKADSIAGRWSTHNFLVVFTVYSP